MIPPFFVATFTLVTSYGITLETFIRTFAFMILKMVLIKGNVQLKCFMWNCDLKRQFFCSGISQISFYKIIRTFHIFVTIILLYNFDISISNKFVNDRYCMLMRQRACQACVLCLANSLSAYCYGGDINWSCIILYYHKINKIGPSR